MSPLFFLFNARSGSIRDHVTGVDCGDPCILLVEPCKLLVDPCKPLVDPYKLLADPCILPGGWPLSMSVISTGFRRLAWLNIADNLVCRHDAFDIWGDEEFSSVRPMCGLLDGRSKLAAFGS
jgi:hypothetical protein